MSRNTSRIDFSLTNDSVNAILQQNNPKNHDTHEPHICFYNQNEDQFLRLSVPLEIPAMPVHHTIDDPIPPDGYIDIILNLVTYLGNHCREIADGTTWYFNPVSIHTPNFYRLIHFENELYLYHLMIDLTCRPLECEILEMGTNNRTHAYRTDRLFFECNYYPVKHYDDARHTVLLDQTIPVTWKGESGQGYMVHGIWMDSDINKFFSKLILPAGKRNHPYYPVTCKQHCISMNAFGQKSPEQLHRISAYIKPALNDILEDLQATPFSELSSLFIQLKKDVPPILGRRWEQLKVKASLNEQDQKEYTVEF